MGKIVVLNSQRSLLNFSANDSVRMCMQPRRWWRRWAVVDLDYSLIATSASEWHIVDDKLFCQLRFSSPTHRL